MATQQEQNRHNIPKILFAAGSKRSKTRDLVICQTCHVVHGAKGNKLTVIDNKGSALCTACHEKQISLIQTKHDLRVSLPDEKNIREQKPSESGPCGSCHLPHNASGKRMWAKPPSPGEPVSQQCFACHGQDSDLKRKADRSTFSHPLNVVLSSEKSTSSRLPLFLEDGTRNPVWQAYNVLAAMMSTDGILRARSTPAVRTSRATVQTVS